MEDPTLIATLIPGNHLTKRVFEKNEERCVSSVEEFNDDPATSSRETTPAYLIPQIVNQSCVLLKFDQPPKDPSKGYAFGTNEQDCDVVLASTGVQGASRIHFHISFDMINGEKRLVLRDSSTNGTAVSFDSHGKDEKRNHFTWILNRPMYQKGGVGEWKIKVHLQNLEFEVQLASHQTCEANYNQWLDQFLILSRTADPPLGGLSIGS
ncbi:MAG: hypothetical protein Q9195_006672 [Heterodermia aff. obscurata]